MAEEKKKPTVKDVKENQEKKKRRPYPQRLRYAVIACQGNQLETHEFKNNEELVVWIDGNVQAGAAGIKDGLCQLKDGRTCLFMTGKKITPKVSVKF